MLSNTELAVPPSESECKKLFMGAGSRISQFRKRRGLTQAQLAQLLSVEQPTVQRWEAGTREPSLDKLTEIAAALGVDIGELLNRDIVVPIGPRLFVKGVVAAGMWREAVECPEADWQAFHGRPDVKAERQHRFGLRVQGDSMNLLYPDGTILECVSTFGHVEPMPGRRVIVVRKRKDGLVEATVKELAVDEAGRLWAVPKSSNPAHAPVRVDTDEDPEIVETRIAAVVVGSYRPE